MKAMETLKKLGVISVFTAIGMFAASKLADRDEDGEDQNDETTEESEVSEEPTSVVIEVVEEG